MKTLPILKVGFKKFQTLKTPLILHTTQNKNMANLSPFEIFKEFIKPHVGTNSFGNKSFMQLMRRFSMHAWGVQFYFLERGGKGMGKGFLFSLVPSVFLPCSHKVPQVVPNNTSVLSHMVCPKFNFCIYKLKSDHICFYFATGVQKGASIGECPMLRRNW